MKKEVIGSQSKMPDGIRILKKHFPQCFDRGGNFNLEKFARLIGRERVSFSKESYGIDWLGKSYARVLITEPTRTLLREDKEWNSREENKNSKNLLIKGDNLEVLKHLVNAYYEKVKVIYIDPPYNTGNDGFIYQDDRKFTPEELSQLAGIDLEKAKRILDFVNSKSNSHSAWLTFMYPRLYIARYLLKEDGVIFVSIDDNEVAQLRLLMDEVFGEENFMALLTRRAMHTVRNSSKDFNKNADYILVYAKDRDYLTGDKSRYIREAVDKSHNYPFKDEKGFYKLDPLHARNYYTPYEYTFKNGIKWEAPEGSYPRYSIETLKKFEEEGRIVFEGKEPKVKRYLHEVREGQSPDVILSPEKVGFNKDGTRRLRECLGRDKVFPQPKPVELIKYLISLLRDKDMIILDFFAGSGTTGDAVMQLNAEDGGNRRYILVQLPEPINPKKNKVAYDFVKDELGEEEPTIFHITKERLVRAKDRIKRDKEEEIEKVSKIIEEIQAKKKLTKKYREKLQKLQDKLTELERQLERIRELDLGFKVFETIDMPEDMLMRAERLTKDLFPQDTYDDSLVEALLTTWKVYDGIPLEEELREESIGNYTIHYNENTLYLMHRGFTTDILVKLLEKIDQDKNFNPTKIVVNGHVFDSKSQREIDEAIKNFSNKKSLHIDVVVRYQYGA